jgi:Cd2+/Zn2+-exporting ATPase
VNGAARHAIGCADCDEAAPQRRGVQLRGLLTGVAAVLALAGCAASWFVVLPSWITPAFVAGALVGAVFPAQRAYRSLRRGQLDINALMVIAVVGALGIGQYEEAAMVVVLFAAAQWLEARSLDRARAAIHALLDLTPDAVRLREGPDERQVRADGVAPGAVMAVRPGERIGLDGVVTEGRSDVNQAPITGESLPVEKAAGDDVFAGTINGHGALLVSVTRRRSDTTLARIVHLVEDAQRQRAPVQQFIDRFAARYTPAIVAGAIAVALVPPLFGAAFDVWLYRALVMLVVACPCALVISTPVSLVSALAGAARHGVLIKGGSHLERLAHVRALAFDKTGTLTLGDVRVNAVAGAPGQSDAEVLRLALAVEQRSEHPVARAIVAAARDRGVSAEPAEGVRALPGLGVEGTVGVDHVTCGTARLVAERGWMTAEAGAAVDAMLERGLSPVLVMRGAVWVGLVGLSDEAREPAVRVVSALRESGVSHVAMLTGDHERAARAVASSLGVTDVRAGLLPADKVDAIRALRAEAGAVAMVGDGINDAPALAAADVGIVMGAMGSDAAIATADIALMTDDLSKLPYALRLSRATLANIRTNVAIALGLKAAFVVLAVMGVATLWMAVLADTGASAIVVANALRLRRYN